MSALKFKKGKPTPGPWHVYMGGNFCKIGAEGYDEYVEREHHLTGPLCVGAAYAYQNTHNDVDVDEPRLRANALLLAASPELRDALAMILPHAEMYLRNAPSHPDNAKIETARLLLKRVRGG